MFRSVGLKADPRTIKLGYDAVIPPALAELSKINGSSASLAIQPISRSWIEAAKAAGGDAIDLDPADGAIISISLPLSYPAQGSQADNFSPVALISTTWNNTADDAEVIAFSEAVAANLTKSAQRAGLLYPFIYVNDAAAGQDPYPLYGKRKSLPRIRAIQRKYDPDGVFRDLVASGFNLFAGGAYS